MNKRFFNQQNLTRRLRMLFVLFAMLLLPLGAWAEDYPITVAGIQVTDANAANVLNDDETATVSFNASTNTLTLNGATINGQITSSIAALKVYLVEQSTITPEDGNAAFVYSGAGTAALTFTTNENPVRSPLTLKGITSTDNIASGYTVSNTFETRTVVIVGVGVEAEDGWKVYNSQNENETVIWYFKNYNLFIGGSRVTSDNLTGAGYVNYNPETHTIPITGETNYPVTSGLEELIIEVSNGSAISASYESQYAISFEAMTGGPSSGTLKFVKAADADLASITLTANGTNEYTNETYKAIEGFSADNIILEDGLSLTSHESMTEALTATSVTFANYNESYYGISIAGTTVTDLNKGDVLGDGGTVSYDSENNILTLNNVSIIPETETPGIVYRGETDLTISLKGTNTVKSGGGCTAIAYFGLLDTAPTLTFAKGDTQACSLLLEAPGETVIDAFTDINHDGLYMIEDSREENETLISTITVTSTLLSGGSGTTADPFIIKTAADLKNFAKYFNNGTIDSDVSVKLSDDISAEGLDCSSLTGFEPIGDGSDFVFTGTFDGNNKTIKNLSITEVDGAYVGMFRSLTTNGKIENLTLDHLTISGGNTSTNNIGGLVGNMDGGTISGCTIKNSSISCLTNTSNPEVGGFVGTIRGGTISNSNIVSCVVKAETSSMGDSGACAIGGGIAGTIIWGTVSGCRVKGTTAVSANHDDEYASVYAGALFGKNTEGSFTDNAYEYTVTVTERTNETKSGYTQRGMGGTTNNEQTQQEEPNPDITANNGAVMYTKTLTLTGGVSYEGVDFYEPLSDDDVLAFAPGQTIDINLYPADGVTISAASLVYTPAGGTEQTVPLENESETAGEYNYVFEMPDANATLTTTIVQSYALWIGETQVTDANKNHILGEGNTTVTFAVTGNEAAGYVNTLTLNGAALTVPVKVGLDNLTIDIQGTNSITTNTTCIQNTAGDNVPSLTFTSTSDVVGSLTLKDTDEGGTNGVISSSYLGHFTINKKLALILLRSGDYTSNTYFFSAGEVHNAQLVPSYGVQVNDMQVYEGNSTNVLGDGKVSFDKSTHTLTLNNASGIETISTTLSTLDIDLVGSNSLYRESNGSIFESASGEAVTINLKSTNATGTLTMEAPSNYGATLKGNNVTLTPVDPIVLLSSDVTENKGTLVYGVSYGLTVAGVTVSNANASNVLGGATATVVFTPADNTASPATPATLTLNGATIAGSIVSGLENLTVVINGENTTGKIEGNTTTNTDKNITFKGGTDGSTLTITSTLNSALEGFAAVSYDGAYPASPIPSKYYTGYQEYIAVHGSDINYPLQTLTISTTPHYPLWIGATQINDNNKDDVFAGTALAGKVSYNSTSKTLSLTNAELSSHYIMSDLDALRISVEGDCVIAAADSSAAVRSMNGAATLTIAKKNSSSTDISTLKLGTYFSTASISWFNSVVYSDFILLDEGATYEDQLLRNSDGESLTQATFTTGLKKPTLQMNYETDTYSFQNPNGGGTLKYSRYFANNEYPDEKNQVDNGSTTFLIFKNGRQYNDPLTVICEVWVEANGNSSEKLYACRLDVKDMTTTYGGTVPTPEFLPKAIEGVTVSGYSLGTHTEVAATVTEGNITLTGAGRQELDAIFSIPDGVEYIKTSTTETPKATFFLDVKPATPILSKATGSYAGTQTITVTNLTPNATAMYYTYEGEEPENPNAQAFPEGGVDISSSKTLAVYYVASYETETSTEYLYSETVRETYTILEDPELAYKQGETAVTTAEWILGKDENVLPTLYNPYDLAPVTYESNNTDVATVATDGTVTVVGIGTAVITATTAETDVYVAGEASYTLTVKRQLDVSFSASNSWATYCGTEDLATPEGLQAYQVTAVDGSTVTSSAIGYIPANTAVLLKDVEGKAASANIVASAYEGETTTFPDNILQGGVAVDVSTITGGTVYVLYKDMFKRATGGTIPANRGYLVVAPSSGNAPELSITIGDDTTGIGTVGCDSVATDNDEWYTLDGQKLQQAPTQKGLYIKNGKKVVINKK